MTQSDVLYESINKDWFYYNEEHDKIYYSQQRQLCEDFIGESRKEQYELLNEIEQLKLLLQQKEDRYTTLQMKKEIIKDRIIRLDNELTSFECEKREKSNTSNN